MRGLLMRLTPFAPDQSGVVSCLYEMGGLLVILDAGGCTGNICGFDEPRWQTKKCALFSAGLRDMDAILGRDTLLLKKTYEACQILDPAFVAFIGTPVPCVIATDLTGIARMAEKKLGIPTLAFPTTGTSLYDAGISQAYRALLTRFTKKPSTQRPAKSLGVFGATPLDIGMQESLLRKTLLSQYDTVILHGFGNGLCDIERAASVSKNLVIAPSGLNAACYLKDHFGIPYEIDYPLLPNNLKEKVAGKKRILIVHQAVFAQALQKALETMTPKPSLCTATFFSRLPNTDTLFLPDEAAFVDLVTQGNFDCILGDSALARALPEEILATCSWIDLAHFAISSRT